MTRGTPVCALLGLQQGSFRVGRLFVETAACEGRDRQLNKPPQEAHTRITHRKAKTRHAKGRGSETLG